MTSKTPSGGPGHEKPPVSKKHVLSATVLMVVALTAAVGLVELTSRWVLDDGMHFDLEMWKYAKDIKRVSSNPEMAHEHTPDTGGVFMGVPVSINSMGLREREVPLEKPFGVVRVLMLGDSLTFGWGVRQEHTPAKFLEDRLNEDGSGRTYEVINAGVGNYNTRMEVAYFLERGRLLDPDVVVLNYFINDAEPTPRRYNNPLTDLSYAAVLVFSAADTVSRRYLGGADWKDYYRSLYDPRSPDWRAAKAAIEELIAYCKEAGIALLIVNYPELHKPGEYPFTSVTEAVERVATEHGAPFVDLLPSVAGEEPQSLWVSPTDAHPNKRANTVFAKTIHQELIAAFPEFFGDGPVQPSD